ncbi:MAG: sulfurtransferase TusA family protein [Dehalococcoidales bacterium]|nr:sulfurtransferase TusA family protein [Dehalococcoidales bacterium]
MNNIRTIDACGLSCPQPVLMTRQALQKAKQGTFEVLVDTTTALENVTRLAKNLGWKLTVETRSGGSYRMVLQK